MKRSNYVPLVPRTIALFIILYQIRFLASDLADTPVFAAALFGALLTALFLHKAKIRGLHIHPLNAVISITLVPWLIRFFIALPRWFFPGVSGGTVILDSLLLNFDRNNFAALLPFYWVAFTSYFSIRSRLFLRAEIIASDTLFLVLFCITPSASMEVYRWPILMIGLFALVLFLQILSLVLSVPPELKLRRKEGILAAAFLLALVIIGGAFFIRPFQERAVERGGGLLEPKLFRFDFSQILRLESEISVNDDLIMIVKKDPMDSHVLLRRYTLSGYGPRQGFYRLEKIDEAAHPQKLPGRRTQLPHGEIRNYRELDQEYYIVNFDPSAFIGMNMPVEVAPFETWDASSFNSAYEVKSQSSDALPFELIASVRGEPGPETLGLSAEEYALYTDYGGDKAIAAYAREIIKDSTIKFRSENYLSYWEKVQMIYYRLKYGEYRYSLKPGIAPVSGPDGGDQLKYFLFTVKKGYCSYYAFAFTLMLRSLGIPSRVAAGFFVDPTTEVFNYHPVRADMAHAWAEVWFPGYGWIEYDPTTEALAEGEEFRFSQGTPPELFERLMKEILENRSRLREKQGEDAEKNNAGLAAIGRRTLKFITQYGPFIAALLLAFFFLALRSGFLWLSRLSKKPRRKSLFLWLHVKRRLALAGFGRFVTGGRMADGGRAAVGSRAAVSSEAALAEAEWAKVLNPRFSGLYAIYLDSAAARFAPSYTDEDCRMMAEHYRAFNEGYAGALCLTRRLLAWLLPPLALVLPGEKTSLPGKSVKIPGIIFIICFLLALNGADAQNNPGTADRLLEDAVAAQDAENWEKAVELFSEGGKLYPDDFRFPWYLGNLYYGRSLYRLAWDEYRKAENIIPWEPGLLMRLANTAGYLNMNSSSAEYLERLLLFEDDNLTAIGSLAWMYFKLHRLSEGERLLLDAMERFGQDGDFSMTLATIYSAMFRYNEAKDSYMRAAKAAERAGDRLFAALVYYNLSILESRFYQYRMAYDCTNTSLDFMNRASGRLARGELYLRRMEMPRTLGEYQEAYGMDNSPLSKLNLAEVYQIGGNLEDAARYANDCLKAKDESWMMNYGIDPVRYKRDIHEILKNCYEGLANAEAFFCPGSVKERVQSIFRGISYRFRFELHKLLFCKYSLLAADAYGVFTNRVLKSGVSKNAAGESSSPGPAGNFHIEALVQYFDAFEAWPRRALSYLRQARSFEEPIIPASAPAYDYEEGRLLKNRKLLAEITSEFDPLWEKDMIADTYGELARMGKKAERQDAAERLFAINRGALLQRGLRLPVKLQIHGDLRSGVIKSAVKAAGLEVQNRDSLRYTLNISRSGDSAMLCELYDGGRGITIYSAVLPLPSQAAPSRAAPSQAASPHAASSKAAERAAFSRALQTGIFNAF